MQQSSASTASHHQQRQHCRSAMRPPIHITSVNKLTFEQTKSFPMEGIDHGCRLRCNFMLCSAGRKSALHLTIQQGCQLTQCSAMQATHTTMLPFESLSTEVRKADILPGLQPNELVSNGNIANADYASIFHPCRESITVHKKNTF